MLLRRALDEHALAKDRASDAINLLLCLLSLPKR
jgi:hypothetical protein